MGLKNFKIVVDEVSPEHKVQPTGIPLTGYIQVETDKVEDYTKVEVTLKGKGEVEWEEERGAGEDREVVKFDAKEVYIKEKVSVWKKADDPDGCFTAGVHSFPFQFTIPTDCPSSFKSNVCEVKYKIKAQIEQPGKDDKLKQTIKVVQLVDADTSNLQEPVRREKTKSVGFLCCAAGDLTYTMELGRSGFNVKGGQIPIQCHVENGTSKEINMEARLFQNIQYLADGGRRYHQEKILGEKSSVIVANTTTDWSPSSLVVPDLIVTTTKAKIFKVEYLVRVCAEIPLSLDPTVDVPVVIGNAALFRTPS